jgi:hypothetical protein
MHPGGEGGLRLPGSRDEAGEALAEEGGEIALVHDQVSAAHNSKHSVIL